MNGKKAKALRHLTGFDVRAPRSYSHARSVEKMSMDPSCPGGVRIWSVSGTITADRSRQQYQRAKRVIRYLPMGVGA